MEGSILEPVAFHKSTAQPILVNTFQLVSQEGDKERVQGSFYENYIILKAKVVLIPLRNKTKSSLPRSPSISTWSFRCCELKMKTRVKWENPMDLNSSVLVNLSFWKTKKILKASLFWETF